MNSNKRLRWITVLMIVVITAGAYYQAASFDFVSYDDRSYITDNVRVQSGLSFSNILWAFTASECSNWHPLVWITYMTGCHFFGLTPSVFHLLNLLFHLANTLLLLYLLKTITKQFWLSAAVAAIFGVHPIHVESVTWISEYKDVLSTFFWLSTTAVYVRFAKNPTLQKYLAVCFLYALGLMAKPMLVSLPFTLLLLDYWPLNRIKADKLFCRHFFSQAGALAKEKIPLFLLSIATALITLIVQHKESIEALPLYSRTLNALVTYAAYIVKMVHPVDLAVFYPHPGTSLAFWKAAASFVLLTAVSIVALRKRRMLPYLTFGWFWFLVTLLPVIGLVQVGRQAMADRYMYIPSIGLSVLLVWGFYDIIRRHNVERKIVAFGFSAIIICLAFLTFFQNKTWQNSETLFQHAIKVTENNYVAHNNLGTYYAEKGELETALFRFQTALKIQPRYYDALINISKAYLQQHKTKEALAILGRLRKRRPFTEEVHHLLGDAYRQIGNRQEAVKCFRNAVTLAPASINTRMKLAGLHLQQDELDKAAQQYTKILKHQPAHPSALSFLATIYARKGGHRQAAELFYKAAHHAPHNATIQYNLAKFLEDTGRNDEALRRYRKALEINPLFRGAQKAVQRLRAGPLAESKTTPPE